MQNSMVRFDPSRVPALTSVFNDAIEKLDVALKDLAYNGRLNEPWLGDEASARVAARYNQVAIDGEKGDGKGSALDCLRQYKAHLQDVLDQLNATAAEYAQSDQDAAAMLRR